MTQEPPPAPPPGSRFHRERWSVVIAAVGGFFVINASNFGACGGQGSDRSCLIGDTVVTDERALVLVFTPLVLGPLVYLVAALLPRWAERMSFASLLAIVVAALGMILAGVAVLRWGAGPPAIVAFAVGGAGLVIATSSRTAQRAERTT